MDRRSFMKGAAAAVAVAPVAPALAAVEAPPAYITVTVINSVWQPGSAAMMGGVAHLLKHVDMKRAKRLSHAH